jgi:hypothetical protein
MARKAWTNNIPIMIGGTSDEGLIDKQILNVHPKMLQYVKFEDLIPFDLKIHLSVEKIKEFALRIKSRYFKNSDVIDEMSYYGVSFMEVDC